MNNRRNYAYFSDIVSGKCETSSATNETRVSAADPTDTGSNVNVTSTTKAATTADNHTVRPTTDDPQTS